MSDRKRILITGAAGRIGASMREHLADRYDHRLMFHSTIPDDLRETDQMVVGDISDFECMLEATRDVDAVLHLAIFNRHRGMAQSELARRTFDTDMKGCYNVYEAARLNGVSTVVLASTNHVTGLNERQGIRSEPQLPVRPDGIYGAGKAFAEALGRFYADNHGLRVFCLRIANFNGRDEPGRAYEPGQSRWLSPRDMAQLTWRCIEAEQLSWGIYYGVSNGGEQKWDIANAVDQLGYAPVDDGSSPQ